MPHVSMGTFAVVSEPVCLCNNLSICSSYHYVSYSLAKLTCPVSQVSILVSKPVLRLGGDPEDIDVEEVVVEGEENFTRLQVATAVTLGVGIIQVN